MTKVTAQMPVSLDGYYAMSRPRTVDSTDGGQIGPFGGQAGDRVV